MTADQLPQLKKAFKPAILGSPQETMVWSFACHFMLTEERRKEYVKVVKNMAEDGRIALRNVRRDARKVLETAEKDGDISKDELDRAEKELDKLTQEHVDQIEKAFVRKEQELLEV